MPLLFEIGYVQKYSFPLSSFVVCLAVLQENGATHKYANAYFKNVLKVIDGWKTKEVFPEELVDGMRGESRWERRCIDLKLKVSPLQIRCGQAM